MNVEPSAIVAPPPALPLPREHRVRAALYPEIPPDAVQTRIRAVDPEIYRKRVVEDCMGFTCSFLDAPKRTRLDACCSWGVDADVVERARIEARRPEIEAHLDRRSKGKPWFRAQRVRDRDFPSAAAQSTRVMAGACVFLRRDGGRRGCGIHAAALALGEAPERLKPLFCSLFPLTLQSGLLTHVEEDLDTLTCSREGPTVYRTARPTLVRLFGDALVEDLDAIEARCVR